MKVQFSRLSEVHEISQQMTYLQPRLQKTFGAIDALIIDGVQHKCYGMQMTILSDHGIQYAPLRKVLTRLEAIGFAEIIFCFCFVVPTELEPNFKQQAAIVAKGNEEALQKPGLLLAEVAQYVIGAG